MQRVYKMNNCRVGIMSGRVSTPLQIRKRGKSKVCCHVRGVCSDGEGRIRKSTLVDKFTYEILSKLWKFVKVSSSSSLRISNTETCLSFHEERSVILTEQRSTRVQTNVCIACTGTLCSQPFTLLSHCSLISYTPSSVPFPCVSFRFVI